MIGDALLQGGCLRCYHDLKLAAGVVPGAEEGEEEAEYTDLAPRGGRLVLFNSRKTLHEVRRLEGAQPSGSRQTDRRRRRARLGSRLDGPRARVWCCGGARCFRLTRRNGWLSRSGSGTRDDDDEAGIHY